MKLWCKVIFVFISWALFQITYCKAPHCYSASLCYTDTPYGLTYLYPILIRYADTDTRIHHSSGFSSDRVCIRYSYPYSCNIAASSWFPECMGLTALRFLVLGLPNFSTSSLACIFWNEASIVVKYVLSYYVVRIVVQSLATFVACCLLKFVALVYRETQKQNWICFRNFTAYSCCSSSYQYGLFLFPLDEEKTSNRTDTIL
jgi:hypothetical protein